MRDHDGKDSAEVRSPDLFTDFDCTFLQSSLATPPYKATSYHESDSVRDEDVTLIIPYTRHGRVWTDNEVNKLSDDIFGEWAEEFGVIEEDIPEELRAVVISYGFVPSTTQS